MFLRLGSTSGGRSLVTALLRAKPNSMRPAFVPVVATSFTSAVVVILANGVRVEIPAVDRELVSHVVQVAAATTSAGGNS